MPNPHRPVYVSWRDEWGECGTGPRMTVEAAERLAQRFDRPGCWAVVIDAKRYVFVAEYGTRFVDLVKQRQSASSNVTRRRKGPGRVAGEQKARRATG